MTATNSLTGRQYGTVCHQHRMTGWQQPVMTFQRRLKTHLFRQSWTPPGAVVALLRDSDAEYKCQRVTDFTTVVMTDTTLDVIILEWRNHWVLNVCLYMLCCSDQVHECDRQTDRQTNGGTDKTAIVYTAPRICKKTRLPVRFRHCVFIVRLSVELLQRLSHCVNVCGNCTQHECVEFSIPS